MSFAHSKRLLGILTVNEEAISFSSLFCQGLRPGQPTANTVKDAAEDVIAANNSQGQKPGLPTSNDTAHCQGRGSGQHAHITGDHGQGLRPGWPTANDTAHSQGHS